MDQQSVMKLVSLLLIFFLTVAVFIGWFWLHLLRHKAALNAWATSGGLQILRFEGRTGTGLFSWWTNRSRHRIIYHLRVRDWDGRERSCWVRFGIYFSPVDFRDQVEVRWEDS